MGCGGSRGARAGEPRQRQGGRGGDPGAAGDQPGPHTDAPGGVHAFSPLSGAPTADKQRAVASAAGSRGAGDIANVDGRDAGNGAAVGEGKAPPPRVPAAALAREAVAAARASLDAGDATAAEDALVRALRELQSAGYEEAELQMAVSFMRASPEYAETLELLKHLNHVIEETLGGGGEKDWTLGVEVKVDFQALKLHVDEETARVLFPDGNSLKIYYRTRGRQLDFKIDCVLPTRTPSGRPSLTGLAAMYHELSLWETWNPIAQNPVPLRPRTAHYNFFQVLSKVLMYRHSELVEERLFFVRDAGVLVLCIEGKSSQDAVHKQHPPPSGYKVMPGQSRTRIVTVPQRLTTLCSVVACLTTDFALPDFVVKLAVSWFMPEVARRMLKAGASAMAEGGPYQPLFEADEHGLYAECRRIADRGAELDEELGRQPCLLKNMPKPDLVTGRAGSLVALEEAIRAGTVVWATRPDDTLEPTGAGLAGEPAAHPAPDPLSRMAFAGDELLPPLLGEPACNDRPVPHHALLEEAPPAPGWCTLCNCGRQSQVPPAAA